MKLFSQEYRYAWDVEPGEVVFSSDQKQGLEGIEVSYVKATLSFVDNEWDIDVDVYGYRLTAKGTRDKRQNGAQNLYGTWYRKDQQQFVAKVADAALALHGLTRAELSGGKYIFEGLED